MIDTSGNNKNAEKYSKKKEYIDIFNIFYEMVFLFLIIFFVSDIFVSWSTSIVSIRYLKISFYSIFLLLSHVLFHLPLDFYSGYIIEHQFNLSTENIAGWLKFQLKSLLFSFILSIPLITLFYFILDRFSFFWWLIAASCVLIISIGITYILPFIIPFFYKLVPLKNDKLKSKIKNILEKGGLELEGVYLINLKSRTKKANAALVGFGKTKRVLLSDTLGCDFKDDDDKSINNKNEKNINEDEIASITAHEVGHYAYNHIWKLILVESFFTYILFYIIYIFSDNLIKLFSHGTINDVVNLPIIFFIFFIMNLFITPINNFFSRFFEYQADNYAVKATSGKTFISSLKKIASINLAQHDPSRFIEIIFHSHPSIKHRIQQIKKEKIKIG